MSRIERFHPGTKVSEWFSGSISGPILTYSSGEGYFGGGYDGSSGLDSIDKLLFGVETCAAISATLSTATQQAGGMSNNGTAGYVGGGQTSAGHSSPVATVAKLIYSGESRSNLGSGLSVGRDEQPGGCANSGTAGYFGGGNENGVWSAGSTVVDKFAFPSDSRSTLDPGLSVQVRAPAAMANSGTAGYYAGGYKYSPGMWNHIDKFAFPNDGRSALDATLSGQIWAGTGVANSGTAGYIASGGWSTVWDRIQFSNDSKSTLWPCVVYSQQLGGAASDNGVAAYFTGGNRYNGQGFTGNTHAGTSNHTHVKEIIKLPYATEINSVITATLSVGRNNLCNGFANCAGSL
jgi:hypothetical protein